jgi:signal transduction histidine kinase
MFTGNVYQSIFNKLDNATLLMNKSCIVDCNYKARALFDCRKDQLIGTSLTAFSPKFQKKEIFSSDLFSHYIDKALKGLEPTFIWQHLTFNKKPFTGQVKMSLIEHNGETLILTVVVNVSNMVEYEKQLELANLKLKQQQKEMLQTNEMIFAKSQELLQNKLSLERNKKRFEAIFNGASDAILLLNKTSIFDFNQSAIDLFGGLDLSEESMLSLSPVKQSDDEFSNELWAHYLEKAKDQLNVQFEWKIQSLRGHNFYARISLNKVIINHKTSFIAIIRDITVERQQKIDLESLNVELEEKQEELSQQNEELNAQSEELILQRELIRRERDRANAASRSKSIFLASMSHEIRTPLNGIIGMLSLLKDTHLSDEQIDYVETIDVSSDSLLNIINDILDYSKIEANQLQLENLPVDIRIITQDVIRILQLKAEEKGLALSFKIKNDVPFLYKADAIRLKQILINYCNNAIKFTDKGSIRIHISLISLNDKFAKLKFEVIDTGIGVSVAQQKKLFKEFSQVDNSISRKYGGTGLGLAISLRLANLMNGEVGLSSELGKGSCFWFSAELELLDSEILDGQFEEKEVVTGLRILLVEDNKINQKVAIHTLKQNKHIISVANDGEEALKMYKRDTFDVILMDIQMPNMNGYESTVAIRKWEADNIREKIRIIAMTANAMKGEKEKCISMGMDDYISKPFKKEELLRVL